MSKIKRWLRQCSDQWLVSGWQGHLLICLWTAENIIDVFGCTLEHHILWWWAAFRNWKRITPLSTHKLPPHPCRRTSSTLSLLFCPQISPVQHNIQFQSCMFPCWLLSGADGWLFQSFRPCRWVKSTNNTFPPHLGQGKWPPWAPPAQPQPHFLHNLCKPTCFSLWAC